MAATYQARTLLEGHPVITRMLASFPFQLNGIGRTFSPETASQYSLKYRAIPSIWGALASHNHKFRPPVGGFLAVCA
jgi:hypothetical protein